MPNRALVLDLETTVVDIHTTEVVQCAVLHVDLDPWSIGPGVSRYFRPNRPIPAGATAVHGITDDQVAGLSHFSDYGADLNELAASCDYVVTFNGDAFDLPIIARLLGGALRGAHIDVYRIWQVARQDNLAPGNSSQPRASRFTGSLGSAWAWANGAEPTGEHDASEDVLMTAEVLEPLLEHYGLEKCLAWSSGPLPGAVDFAGKLRWRDGRAVLTFGKHKGQSLDTLVKCDRHYLMWVLREDFHADTKRIISEALDGRLPRQ